jgi:hypothetical protein
MGEEGVGALNPCSIKQDNKPDYIRLISKQKRKALPIHAKQGIPRQKSKDKCQTTSGAKRIPRLFPPVINETQCRQKTILAQRTPYRIYFNHPQPECQAQKRK